MGSCADCKNLRALRKAKGWSIRELSSRAKVSTGLISQIENEISIPTIDTVCRLAKALGVTVEELCSCR